MIAAIWLIGQCSIFVRNREQLANPPVSLVLDEAAVERLDGIGHRLGARRAEAAGLSPVYSQEIPGAATKIPFSGPSAAYNECLKFNRPFENRGWRENRVMRYEVLRRFIAKLVHDVLPAALASLIGGLVFTHFQLGQHAGDRSPCRLLPASPEMMRLLRDEHGLILSYVQAQAAIEKKQLSADESPTRSRGRRAAGSRARGFPGSAPRPVNVVSTTAKPSPPRGKAPIVGASLPPLVVADAQQTDSAKPDARDEDSLIARTMGIRDHVIAVTHRAVSVIGGIPSWIGSIGDRIGGEDLNPRPPANFVSAS